MLALAWAIVSVPVHVEDLSCKPGAYSCTTDSECCSGECADHHGEVTCTFASSPLPPPPLHPPASHEYCCSCCSAGGCSAWWSPGPTNNSGPAPGPGCGCCKGCVITPIPNHGEQCTPPSTPPTPPKCKPGAYSCASDSECCSGVCADHHGEVTCAFTTTNNTLTAVV